MVNVAQNQKIFTLPFPDMVQNIKANRALICVDSLELSSIFSEYVVGLSKEQFFNILKFVYRTPYDFLCINMDEPWDTMYHRNFNKLILGGV